MVALKLVFVSLLSALVATALPVPQVAPPAAPSADSTSTVADGASEDWFLPPWKRQVAPPAAATSDDTTTGAEEDWFIPPWKRQVAPGAEDDDTTTTGASEDWGGFEQDYKRDDDSVAVAPAAADSTTDEGDFSVDSSGLGWTQVWKRDDAVAPAAADSTTTSGNEEDYLLPDY